MSLRLALKASLAPPTGGATPPLKRKLPDNLTPQKNEKKAAILDKDKDKSTRKFRTSKDKDVRVLEKKKERKIGHEEKTAPARREIEKQARLSFIDFHSKLLNILRNIKIKTRALTFLDNLKNFFIPDNHGKDVYSMEVDWVFPTGKKTILITIDGLFNHSKTKESITFSIYDINHPSKPLVEYDIGGKDKQGKRRKITTDITNTITPTATDVFSASEIEELDHYFSTRLNSTRPSLKSLPSITKEDFIAFTNPLAFRSLPYKLDKLAEHSTKTKNSAGLDGFSFHINLAPACDFKITVSPVSYKSWAFSEDQFSKFHLHYNPATPISDNQLYYQWTVTTLPKLGEKPVDLLKIRFTADGVLGELKDLENTPNLTGTQVFEIYNFCQVNFLHLRRTAVVDESKLEAGDDKILLRLKDLLLKGETWYQKLFRQFQSNRSQFSLFKLHNLPTVGNGLITQNQEKWAKAGKDLTILPLKKWHQALRIKDQVKSERQIILENLCLKYHVPINLAEDKSEEKFDGDDANKVRTDTLQNLLNKINDASKRDAAEKTRATKETKEEASTAEKKPESLFQDLVAFHNLLTHGIDIEEGITTPLDSFDKTAPDYDIKCKVHTLLWGGYFWCNDWTPGEQHPIAGPRSAASTPSPPPLITMLRSPASASSSAALR